MSRFGACCESIDLASLVFHPQVLSIWYGLVLFRILAPIMPFFACTIIILQSVCYRQFVMKVDIKWQNILINWIWLLFLIECYTRFMKTHTHVHTTTMDKRFIWTVSIEAASSVPSKMQNTKVDLRYDEQRYSLRSHLSVFCCFVFASISSIRSDFFRPIVLHSIGFVLWVYQPMYVCQCWWWWWGKHAQSETICTYVFWT